MMLQASPRRGGVGLVCSQVDLLVSAINVAQSTGDKILAEAAPNDCIWGIGLRCTAMRALVQL